MHASVWETVADALFWMQLCLVFSGFILMAYLALKVFPRSSLSKPPDAERDLLDQEESRAMTSSDERSDNENARLMVAGNYRLESFPPQRAGKVIEFPNKISKA